MYTIADDLLMLPKKKNKKKKKTKKKLTNKQTDKQTNESRGANTVTVTGAIGRPFKVQQITTVDLLFRKDHLLLFWPYSFVIILSNFFIQFKKKMSFFILILLFLLARIAIGFEMQGKEIQLIRLKLMK